jgi:hypothetical protein
MDILAGIFAYLACIGGLLGALAISFMLYVSPHGHGQNVQQAAATGRSITASHVTTVAQAKPAAQAKLAAKGDKSDKGEQPKDPHVASSVAPEATPAATPTNPAISLRHKTQLASRAQNYRRLVEEQRARRWAYQQDPDFEARFLGYAD